jgi:hypothetical protein
VNVWLAPGLPVHADQAATDARLADVLEGMFDLLGQSGVAISMGDVDYDDPDFDLLARDELDDLFETSDSATEVRLNLFFVIEVFGDGVVGASATISAPKRNGTQMSGVAVDYDGVPFFRNARTIGAIAAHETGHFLGLYHTVSSNGDFDIIDDTANCPVSGTDGICSVTGGNLLMHWEYRGGTLITPGQGLVLRAHPVGTATD